MAYQELYEKTAALFLRQLEQGKTPFQKAASAAEVGGFPIPTNASTGKAYRGLNALWLSMQPFEDPRWMTMKQANKMEMRVPENTKATMISIVTRQETFPVLDEHGKAVRDENGMRKFETVKLETPIEDVAWVFNAKQFSMPPLPEKKIGGEEGIQRIQQLVEAAGIVVDTVKTHAGRYDAAKDSIAMFSADKYPSTADYYAQLLHEIAHWTGQPDRLNRVIGAAPGEAGYGKEELRAGLATMMLSAEFNIGMNAAGHYKEYLPEWKNMLSTDPHVLLKVTEEANEIVEHIKGLEISLGLREDNSWKAAPVILLAGDEIPYNQTIYKVNELLKGGKVMIQDQRTEKMLRLSTSDGLYKSLVQAKVRLDTPDAVLEADKDKTESLTEVAEVAEEKTGYTQSRR